MASIIKTIYGRLLDWSGLANVPAALKALAGLKGSTGQIIEISGTGVDGTVSALTAVDKPAGSGSTVPTKVSAFENDAGYTTEVRVQELLAAVPTFKIEVVQELPAAGAEKTIYLVPFADDSGSYLEYLYVNGAWEVIGSGQDSGENAGLSATAQALLITILSNANYDTDQSANITALEAELAGGGSGGDSGEDAPDDATTEELTDIIYMDTWPTVNDTGEWAYTPSDNAYMYVAFLPGSLYGGKLKIEYNTEEITQFDISVRTSTSDGKAAHLTSKSVPDIIWLAADQAGSADTGKITASPTTYDIPEGEKPMVILRRGNGSGPEITNNRGFCEWVKGGGVKCTVTVGEEA